MSVSFPIKDLHSGLPDSSREAEFLCGLGNAYRDLYISVLSIVGNRNDADDVIQEVCMLLWRRFEEFEEGTNFRKWATAYAFNIAKAYMRRRRKEQGYGLSDHVLVKLMRMQNAGTELFELRREVLYSCLAKLREQDRRFLLARYGGKATPSEYARTMKVPIATVYTRLKRLRKQLVDCLRRTLGREDDF